jgi:ABC-type lipoprotein export system ATPase subunit
MEIRELTILGGRGKRGEPELVPRVSLEMGRVVSIVGPTGSGKTELINDVERFANGSTPSGRRILVDGEPVPEESIGDPSRNPVALITQHTNFLSDLPVSRFLEIHAEVRHNGAPGSMVDRTLEFANRLTGEPILLESAMTELSGGQTRALLIADAVVIGNSPIILLDEIENAGIHRTAALELLHGFRKIFLFVTHDPRIALLSDSWIVMKGGAMQKVIVRGERERRLCAGVERLDDLLADLRAKMRLGEMLSVPEFDARMRALSSWAGEEAA